MPEFNAELYKQQVYDRFRNLSESLFDTRQDADLTALILAADVKKLRELLDWEAAQLRAAGQALERLTREIAAKEDWYRAMHRMCGTEEGCRRLQRRLKLTSVASELEGDMHEPQES